MYQNPLFKPVCISDGTIAVAYKSIIVLYFFIPTRGTKEGYPEKHTVLIQTLRGTQLYQIKFALPWVLLLQAPKSIFLCVEEGQQEYDSIYFAVWVWDTWAQYWGSSFPSHVPTCMRLQPLCGHCRVSPCTATSWQTGTSLPSASWRYFCPTNFRYSSIALVASVFSLKIKTSCSPQRSTSDITKSVKKSWRKRSNGKRLF